MMTGTPRPDVALVRPRDLGAVPPGAPVQDPLGVGYLAAALRAHGFRTVVIDAHALDLDDAGLVGCLAQLQPRAVGLSLHSFADYPHCVSISRALAAFENRPYCVWGGEHATFHAERILRQHLEVDAVVLGEGDESFGELLTARVGRDRPEVEPRPEPSPPLGVVTDGRDGSVAGVVLRRGDGRILHGGFRPAIADLDALPEPHKDVVELALHANRPVTLSLLTGRGCTHSCSFCTAHDFMRLGGGVAWRRRSPARVADELQTLAARYLIDERVHPVVQFQDVIFLGTSRAARNWVERFLGELEERRLHVPFYCMTRADSIIVNHDLLPRLVASGLWSVEVGIECGIDRILAMYNKRNSAEENERAVQLLRAHAVTYDASGFIMFDPRMTLDELRENATYLARFGAATWDFFVTRLQLYPGTAVREEMIRKGLFDGEEDVGRTSGYAFEDPRVGLVADYARYYDLSIRRLDLALRDSKAHLARQLRRGDYPSRPLADAVDLVHATYCSHLLSLADLAEDGTLPERADELIASFLHRVFILEELLHDLLNRHEMLDAMRAPELVALQ